jgi:hypothetical protein
MGVHQPVARVTMTAPPGIERLSDRQYAVLLIRALIDRENHLLGGEVGGPDVFRGPERWVRFWEPAGLLQALEVWLRGRPRPP